MVVDVLVAQRQSKHTLTQQGRQTVIATGLTTRIAQRAGHLLDQTDPPIRLSQQHNAAIGRDLTARKLRLDPASLHAPKTQNALVAFRHGGFAPLIQSQHLNSIGLQRIRRAFS